MHPSTPSTVDNVGFSNIDPVSHLPNFSPSARRSSFVYFLCLCASFHTCCPTIRQRSISCGIPPCPSCLVFCRIHPTRRFFTIIYILGLILCSLKFLECFETARMERPFIGLVRSSPEGKSYGDVTPAIVTPVTSHVSSSSNAPRLLSGQWLLKKLSRSNKRLRLSLQPSLCRRC
jgi:hypothetical protein